ncbi:hypothetical protein Gotur_003839 [Gossypium turneri]
MSRAINGKGNFEMLKREKTFCKGVRHNSVIELKASRSKIEELKGKIEELETALHNCELRVKLLEVNNEQWQEQLHRSQDQVMDRDYVMAALTQV